MGLNLPNVNKHDSPLISYGTYFKVQYYGMILRNAAERASARNSQIEAPREYPILADHPGATGSIAVSASNFVGRIKA